MQIINNDNDSRLYVNLTCTIDIANNIAGNMLLNVISLQFSVNKLIAEFVVMVIRDC